MITFRLSQPQVLTQLGKEFLFFLNAIPPGFAINLNSSANSRIDLSSNNVRSPCHRSLYEASRPESLSESSVMNILTSTHCDKIPTRIVKWVETFLTRWKREYQRIAELDNVHSPIVPACHDRPCEASCISWKISPIFTSAVPAVSVSIPVRPSVPDTQVPTQPQQVRHQITLQIWIGLEKSS